MAEIKSSGHVTAPSPDHVVVKFSSWSLWEFQKLDPPSGGLLRSMDLRSEENSSALQSGAGLVLAESIKLSSPPEDCALEGLFRKKSLWASTMRRLGSHFSHLYPRLTAFLSSP